MKSASLEEIVKSMQQLGAAEIYVKPLKANDNSKNQIYFGSSFDIVNALPILKIEKNKNTYHAHINFEWMHALGRVQLAPHAKIILYPDYPEIRFSAFLRACKNAPALMMAPQLRSDERLLLLGVIPSKKVIGIALDQSFKAYKEIKKNELGAEIAFSVFKKLTSSSVVNTETLLLKKLLPLTNRWIAGQKIKNGKIVPYKAVNAGGYTLEAALGIPPNSKSEPDLLGWELKQCATKIKNNIWDGQITLMTPEPDDGIYITRGISHFMKKYGYPDKSGKPNRINFSSPHYYGKRNINTGLCLEIIGYDKDNKKISDPDGGIVLLDESAVIAAKWSFAYILGQWAKKHNQAVYVPCIGKSINNEYMYGAKFILCKSTDFTLFLDAIIDRSIVYDPGIKLENNKPKKRSQFRTKIKFLEKLYKNIKRL